MVSSLIPNRGSCGADGEDGRIRSRVADALGPDQLDDINRLRAAGWLGTVTAHEDNKKYGKLHLLMSALLQDAERGNYVSLPTDVRAALSVCSDLNLPH